jgi:hypothetical protein
MKKYFIFFLSILFALTVAFAPQTALAHHEDENCADWGTCDDYNPPYYDPCPYEWWNWQCW